MGGEPGGGQELREIGLGIAGEGFEEAADVGEGLDPVGFGAGHDAVEHGCRAATVVAAEEQEVFAADRAGADHPLAQVIINGQAAVLAVAHQAVPAGQHVTNRLADRALGEHGVLCPFQPLVELAEDRQ